MEKINVKKTKNKPLHEDLVYKAARFGGFGWLAFFITLILLLGQNIYYSLKPAEVMAAENGKVIGTVVFGETSLRPHDTIIGDVKSWIASCTSLNKHKIYEDLAVCLNHMTPSLAEKKLEGYEKADYAPYIASFGCDRTEVNFDDERTKLYREKANIYAEVYGEIVCHLQTEKAPSHQAFASTIEGLLNQKTGNLPLGFSIARYVEIDE